MSCNLCELHKTCQSIKIEGRGSDKPKFMFVGIAPGLEDDAQGKSFVGNDGQLLLDAIEQYGLKPARITYAVRCMPPSERSPKKVEIEKCQDYLFQEIEKYKPEIIIALGNVPLKVLTGKDHITEWSGRQVGERFNAKIFALVNPNFVISSPKNQTMFENHLQALKNLASGKSKKLKPVKIYTPFDALNPYFNSKEPIPFSTFDFETDGEYKQFGGKIRLCGIRYGGKSYVIDAEHKQFKTVFRQYLQSSGKKCAYNSIFETRWCLDEWGITPTNLVYDPMLMHYLLDENKPHDLETAAGDYIGVDPWDIQPLMLENDWTWATIPISKLASYNALDIKYTHRLNVELYKRLKQDENLFNYYKKILLPVSQLCAKLEHRGMMIDKAWATKIDREYEQKCSLIAKELEMFPQVQKYVKSKRIGDQKFRFNLSSPAQIADIVFKVFKERSILKTNRGKPSARADNLKLLKGKNPFVNQYLEWKELNILRNNYLQKFPAMADKNSILHPSFNPAFQVTGRISVSNPPAANVPKDSKTRGIITSRFEGGLLLERDFSQLELRLVASESNEPAMIEAFRQNKDLHGVTARALFGKGFTDEQRKKAKMINFAIVYGATEYTIAEKLQITVDDAAILVDRLKETYPNIFKWMNQQHQFIKENEYIENKFGMKRRFPGIKDMENREQWRAFRQAGNFPIQSLGAIINNLSGVWISNHLELNHMQSVYFHQVHDSTLVDCHPDETELVKEITGRIMEVEVPKKYCSWLKVPLKTDYKLTERWGYDAKE